MSNAATSGKIALSAGGACDAAMYCVIPRYEPPHMPTLPSHQDCLANQAIISAASSVSAFEKSPS
jgi:hypothetical protein